jgi:signal transduction histidine kinase
MTSKIGDFLSSARIILLLSARLLSPLLLGTAIIGIVIATVSFGGKRTSLAALAESGLLRFSLKHSVYPASSESPVAIISASNDDFEKMSHAPHALIKDLHIQEYAKVLAKVASTNPRMIYVSWLAAAHPLDEDYFSSLSETIDHLGIAGKTIMALPIHTSAGLPDTLAKRYQIAEARDCYYEVNSFCTFNPSWTWMPQRVAELMWNDKSPWTLSTNLPHTLPNYALHLPSIKTLKTFSFTDVIQSSNTIASKSVVFIGSNIDQLPHFADNKEILQKTRIPESSSDSSLMHEGLPLHVFWAAMAQMFDQNETVRIVPEWLSNIILVAMGLGTVVSIMSLGGLALGPFIVCAMSLPLMNVISLRTINVYLPIVPIITAGLTIFTAATFFSITQNAYQRWRVKALHDATTKTLDIKENFISLLSHNLNTPIAQLRGLAEMLADRCPNPRTLISVVQRQIEYMRVGVRVVLATTAAQAQVEPFERMTVHQFFSMFEDQESGLFKQLGITLTTSPQENDEDKGEIWFYRFKLNSRICIASLTFAILKCSFQSFHTDIEVHCEPLVFEPSDPQALRFIVRPTPISQRDTNDGATKQFLVSVLQRFFDALTRETRHILIQHRDAAVVLLVSDQDSANVI